MQTSSHAPFDHFEIELQIGFKILLMSTTIKSRLIRNIIPIKINIIAYGSSLSISIRLIKHHEIDFCRSKWVSLYKLVLIGILFDRQQHESRLSILNAHVDNYNSIPMFVRLSISFQRGSDSPTHNALRSLQCFIQFLFNKLFSNLTHLRIERLRDYVTHEKNVRHQKRNTPLGLAAHATSP